VVLPVFSRWISRFVYLPFSMDYRTQAPPILRDFLAYHETIQGHSRKTADEYFLDLRTFFRYIKIEKGKVKKYVEEYEKIKEILK